MGVRVESSSKCSLSPYHHHHYAAYENDHGDVGGGEYGSGYQGDVDNYLYQVKGGGYIGVRAESSSKCSLSSTNTAITQLLKMTMETSEEVSTG